jgi:hypothetical protein
MFHNVPIYGPPETGVSLRGSSNLITGDFTNYGGLLVKWQFFNNLVFSAPLA